MEPVDWSDPPSIEVRVLDVEGVEVAGPPWFSAWPVTLAVDVRAPGGPPGPASLALSCEGPRGAVRVDGVEVRAAAPAAGPCAVDVVPVPQEAWRDGQAHVEVDLRPEWGSAVLGEVRVGHTAVVGAIADARSWERAAGHGARFMGWIGWVLVGVGHAMVGARLRDRAALAYGLGLLVMASGEGAQEAFWARLGPWIPVTAVLLCNVVGTVSLTAALGRFFRLRRGLVRAAIGLELVGVIPGGVPVMMVGWLLIGLSSLWAGVHQRRSEAAWVAVAIALVLPYNVWILWVFLGFDHTWASADALRWLYIAAPPITGTAMLAHRHLATWRNAQRFVPTDFLHALGHRDLAELRFGEQVAKTKVVWFSDIRGFTTTIEGLAPGEVQHVLTVTLGTQEEVIRRHGGYVDKYIGDAVMALFDDPDAAVAAALEARREVGRRSAGAFSVGIGLHRGPVMLGTVGSAHRMDCTVVGDAVNLASRVESATKRYGSSILITGSVRDPLRLPAVLRPVERVIVKGRTQPVALFEVLDPDLDRDRAATADAVERARAHLDEGAPGPALALLKPLAVRCPTDGVIQRLLERAEAWSKTGVPEDPSVVVLHEK